MKKATSKAKAPAKTKAPASKTAAKAPAKAKAPTKVKASTKKTAAKASATKAKARATKAPAAKAKAGASKAPAKNKSAASKAPAKSRSAASGASQQIDAKIASLGDWRGKTLARMRALIHEAVPGVVEEVKWGGVPVWSHDGILCTGETYKSVVKLTFAKGASVADPKKLFNSSLEGNTRRALDLKEGDKLDERAFKELVRAAAALNQSKPAKGRK